MRTSMTIKSVLTILTLGVSGAGLANPGNTTVNFSNGVEGWVNLPYRNGVGSWIEPSAGMDGGADWRTVNPESWGLTWSNKSNASFVGDYTSGPVIQIGIDVKTNSIKFLGNEVSRDLIVELRDYDRHTSARYTSVWLDLGPISANEGWQHLSAVIGDTSDNNLPAGWQFYDGSGTAPILSFSNFLKGIDEIAFTTMAPGMLYGYASFDVTVDNISVSAVPESSTFLSLALGLGLVSALSFRWRGRAT